MYISAVNQFGENDIGIRTVEAVSFPLARQRRLPPQFLS